MERGSGEEISSMGDREKLGSGERDKGENNRNEIMNEIRIQKWVYLEDYEKKQMEMETSERVWRVVESIGRKSGREREREYIGEEEEMYLEVM